MLGLPARATVILLLLGGCPAPNPAPAAPMSPAPAAPVAPPTNPKSGAVLEYVGGTAIQANDPKALSAWYSERFGLKIDGEMPGGFYGGFEWNGTSFNIAIVAAGGSHPGAAPGTAYLVFHVSDYDGFLAARAAKDLTPFKTTGEKTDKYGRFASFRDPEGNEVDVWGH
jgi:predicted enzyme related to lactoylglutathione lyase